jgi:hypothetical protein
LAAGTGTPQIDKSVLAFPKPRRIRDRDDIQHVIKQSCLICERRPSDPHHPRFAQSRALGRKVSDEFTVPLPRNITVSSIVVLMKPLGGRRQVFDPFPAARSLWLQTRPLIQEKSADPELA